MPEPPPVMKIALRAMVRDTFAVACALLYIAGLL
jgi:hypothetical protein